MDHHRVGPLGNHPAPATRVLALAQGFSTWNRREEAIRFLLDANGQELDVRLNVDISVVYSMTEFAIAHGIAVAHVD